MKVAMQFPQKECFFLLLSFFVLGFNRSIVFKFLNTF